jgi:hypothetical protein
MRHVEERTWDLAAAPARLVEEKDGGGAICTDVDPRASGTRLAEPFCIIDHVARRATCRTEHPRCGVDSARVKGRSHVAVPRHDPAASLRVADLAACAVTIGDDATERLAGPVAGARFAVVAVDDRRRKTLELWLRVEDGTPVPLDLPNDDASARDHFELWLADRRDEPGCGDAFDLDDYCKHLGAAKMAHFTIAPIADGTFAVRVPRGAPGAPTAHGDHGVASSHLA